MKKNIIFIHGLESSGNGFKGRFFKKIFPDILTPDFQGDLNERMEKLYNILDTLNNLIIIGSSFGGLMGTIYSFNYENKVDKLILLAPALIFYDFKEYKSLDIPVTIFHGKNDTIIPLNQTKDISEKLFKNLVFNITNDDHMLHNTVQEINWKQLILLS